MNKLIIFFLVLVVSCKNIESEKEFIFKYGDNNFNFFRGTSIFLRGFDREGHPVIFYSSDKDSCKAPFIVKMDANGIPISLDNKLIEKECTPDITKALNQVKEYFKYNICFLYVDKNGTVKVNVDEISTPDLIRVTNRSFLTEYQKKNWRNIKNNWYIKR